MGKLVSFSAVSTNQDMARFKQTSKRKQSTSAETPAVDHEATIGQESATNTARSGSQAPKRVKIEDSTEVRGLSLKMPQAHTLYDDIVYVKVGPEQTQFGIHRGLLGKASKEFEKVLQNGLETQSMDMVVTHENETTVISLLNENPETYARVNTFLYSRKFLNDGEQLANVAWDHLVSVYLFSVQKGMTQLHNKCIDVAIIKTHKGGLFPSQNTINALYKVHVPASPLRKLLIKLFAGHCDLKSAILKNPDYHQTFMNWLVIDLHEMAKKGTKADDLNIWKTRREYYATDSRNPIAID